MWNKIKNLLNRGLNVVAAIFLVGLGWLYILMNGVIVTSIINDLRLDTYVNYQTGVAIVLLICLLGWGPLYIMKNLNKRG